LRALRRLTYDLLFQGIVAMLANILVFTFVIAFVAFVDVLLITVIWPDLFGKRREPHLDTIADANRRLYLPN
jgi:hypothetical protein